MNRIDLAFKGCLRHGGLAVLLLAVLLALPARAQVTPSAAPISLTLDEAIQVALANNYALQRTRLDLKNAGAQVKEGWGQLLPQIALNSSYTRNLESANPFAGSQAGSLFNSFAFIDWLAFNEQARTDDDPATNPISLAEFFSRRQAGLDEAGATLTGGGNPFSVPNQFSNTISITQKIFDGRAIWGAAGADKYLEPFTERRLEREEQLLIARVKQAFYQALLAQARVEVARQSVARTSRTLEEVGKRVAQGVTPKFDRLSTEVELANLETQLVQAENAAAQATDDLKLLLGLPIEQPVSLRGRLEAEDPGQFIQISAERALALALERRPDVEQAWINVELQKVQEQATRAQYFPTLDAFASIGYLGNVPDNRLVVLSDPDDPFRFTTQRNDFFSDAYWDWNVNVGFRLSWTLFDGFQRRQQVQQRKIAVSQARLQYDELVQQVKLEVEQALRNLEAARQRIEAQRRNVDRAELNYDYALARLQEGVASPLEVREASEQLDQTRLNYLQAMHDLLGARAAFEAAVGLPDREGLPGFNLTETRN
ncbi:TolC family protein [Rhodocaloribacter litoris]|uniref:TolC family protein n=1 Tax=Rhodocaloribacter litoris TaxID=2558931 RepID=UPI00141EA364|nr:TolC family protein [Rhodocaloribacter litoris]QXD14579.1 TolC family protein [Rhodocaloribacter litoris]GIV59652.1 MAG: transporter [Rhodothermaceae bacterium]